MKDKTKSSGKVILGLIIITAVILFSGSIYTKANSNKERDKRKDNKERKENLYKIETPQGVLVNSSVRG